MLQRPTHQIFDHLRAIGSRVHRVVGDIKAGLDALHRVQFDEPWARDHRPTYEQWQAYIAPRPRAPKTRREAAPRFVARPLSR